MMNFIVYSLQAGMQGHQKVLNFNVLIRFNWYRLLTCHCGFPHGNGIYVHSSCHAREEDELTCKLRYSCHKKSGTHALWISMGAFVLLKDKMCRLRL